LQGKIVVVTELYLSLNKSRAVHSHSLLLNY